MKKVNEVCGKSDKVCCNCFPVIVPTIYPKLQQTSKLKAVPICGNHSFFSFCESEAQTII